VAAAVHNWATAVDADALVTTGDNIYPDGEPEDFDEAWHAPYGWVDDEGLRVVASLGNHDIRHNDGKDVMELLDMPHPWYSTRVGAAQLIVLDANRPEDDEQKRWLGEQLDHSEARWTVVVFHHPVYSCSSHGSTEDVIAHWLPILERGAVDLVLNGHDHNYQRFREGTTNFVVAGGGGADLYDLRECAPGVPERLAGHDSSHSFVTVEGDAGELRLAAVDVEGKVVDQTVLTS
jgi:hypothetical protein